MLVLTLIGMPIHVMQLPLALLVFAQLFVLALGFSFLFAAIQVFVRDLSQVLGQIIPLWMFVSPILYPRDFLPPTYRGWLDLNPFTFYPEYFRAILLGIGTISIGSQVLALLIAIAVCAVGYGVFRRLDPHFEDFL